jgi:hypothetical protein
MGRGQAFADLLQDALGGWTPPPRAGYASGVATATLFFDLDTDIRPHRAAAAFAAVMPPVARPEPRRVTHTLSAPERRAFETLLRFGGRLDAAFTWQELRSAFRSLVLRYHPDRHPGSSDQERSRLAACFTEIATAYQQLQGVAARPTSA